MTNPIIESYLTNLNEQEILQENLKDFLGKFKPEGIKKLATDIAQNIKSKNFNRVKALLKVVPKVDISTIDNLAKQHIGKYQTNKQIIDKTLEKNTDISEQLKKVTSVALSIKASIKNESREEIIADVSKLISKAGTYDFVSELLFVAAIIIFFTAGTSTFIKLYLMSIPTQMFHIILGLLIASFIFSLVSMGLEIAANKKAEKL